MTSQTKMADNHEVLQGRKRTISLQDTNELLFYADSEVVQNEQNVNNNSYWYTVSSFVVNSR